MLLTHKHEVEKKKTLEDDIFIVDLSDNASSCSLCISGAASNNYHIGSLQC